jgi:DNA-binding transcriptional regulator PaaX
VDIIARDPRLPAELWPGYGLAALRRSYRALMEATGARMKAFVARATNGM